MIYKSDPSDDSIWMAGTSRIDPFLGAPPDDTIPAISFLINPGGEVSGIQPEPFGGDPLTLNIFLTHPPDDGMPAAGPTVVGRLDFSGVTGTLGSLNLSGLKVVNPETGATIYDVDPFTIQAVPEPSTFILMGIGLAGLAGCAARRRCSRKLLIKAR